MNKVESYKQILDDIRIIKNLKEGFLTNFYPDIEKVNKWIKYGELYSRKINNTLLLFRKREYFFNLFYCASSKYVLDSAIRELEVTYSGKHFIVDLLGSEKNVIVLKEIFIKNNFYNYVSLCRMSKSTNYVNSTDLNTVLKTAESQHSDKIFELLNTYFDPIAEQLPYLEEIINWIELGHIKIYEKDGLILGFVIYDLIGLTSYLRYWFVHPKYRDKKIGSALLKRFFYDSKGTKRQLFWVIQSNDNAIKRYKHYGFKPENMFDIVLTNKNIKYGK